MGHYGSTPIRAAVVGATGYTGVELIRLLIGHPRVDLAGVYARSAAGQPLSEVLPSLAGQVELEVAPFEANAVDAEVVFCALPHGASAGVVDALLDRGKRVLDLSADFRLSDAETYEAWYGEHLAPGRFGTGVYGLVELNRSQLAGASLVAVPGCFPTAAVLAAAPLLAEGLVEPDGLIIDAKTGASGAGRKPTPSTHLPEVGEGVRAYKAGGQHRHTPEIEQELSKIAGRPIQVLFTPHLVPMTRGILATVYGRQSDGASSEACTAAAARFYQGSSSVVVRPPGTHVDTAWVRGANRAQVSYTSCGRTRRVIAQCVIDNLVKGAAGQAVQCLNLMCGWDEGLGLGAAPVWP